MNIIYRGKRKYISCRKVSIFSFGLMFRSRKTNNLLFEFKKDSNYSLTALFVFFPFIAVWLDEENRVLSTRIIKPFEFSISAKRKYRKILEIPVNKKNMKIIKFLVGKQRFK